MKSSDRSGDGFATIAVITMLGAAAVAGFNIQPMYLGALADHLGLSAEQLGVIAGLEVAGSALAGVAATWWVRRWPWRRVAMGGLLVIAGGNFVSVFISDFELLATVRFLTGFLGVGTNYALSIAALGDTKKTERNFSIAVLVQVSVAILGFTLLPSLIAEAGTSGVFLPLALLALAVVPFLRYLPQGDHGEASVDEGQSPATPASIWLALGCMAVWYVGVGGVWAFLERIGVDAGIDAQGIGNALAIGMAVGLLGAVAAAVAADRFGRVLPFAVAMIGQVVAVWMLADLQALSGLVIVVCLYNGTWNFALPYILAAAALADTRGRLVVLMSTAQAVGLTAGASVAGMVIGRYGLLAVSWQGGAAAIAALLVFVWLAATTRREPGT